MKGWLSPETAAFLWADDFDAHKVGSGVIRLVGRHKYDRIFEVTLNSFDDPAAMLVVLTDGRFIVDRKYDAARPAVQSVLTQLSNWIKANSSAGPTSDAEDSSESRPKGTDEVVEATSCTSNDVHGGDSASGEVPDGESGGGEEVSTFVPGGDSGGTGGSGAGLPTGEAGEQQSTMNSSGGAGGNGAVRPAGEAPQGASEASASERGDLPCSTSGSAVSGVHGGPDPAGAGRGASEPGQSGETHSASSADQNAPSVSPGADGEGTGGHPAPVPAESSLRGGDEAGSLEPARESAVPSPGGAEQTPDRAEEAPERAAEARNILRHALRRSGMGAAGPSISSRRAHGGVFSSLRRIAPPPPGLVARARRALARMVYGGETDAGPRWDFDRFAVKVAGYLRSPDVRDRRPESGRPAVLVLPDVSGSMNAFAREVLKLADAVRRVGVAGADVVVVAHSNGCPLEWAVNAGPIHEEECRCNDDDAAAWVWYEALIRRYNVQAVVVAADWDAAWLYRRIAESGLVVYWLDVWGCSEWCPWIVPFPPRSVGKVDWPRSAQRRVRYAFGCGTAEEAVRTLERMLWRGGATQ